MQTAACTMASGMYSTAVASLSMLMRFRVAMRTEPRSLCGMWERYGLGVLLELAASSPWAIGAPTRKRASSTLSSTSSHRPFLLYS